MKRSKNIGILTSGGDCPGLNAAIRGVGKAALGEYDMQIVGFRDGFRGLMENRAMPLDQAALSGILTVGGTILGTSRDKPRRMLVGGTEMDVSEAIVANYEKHHLDALVCLGGGGTQKNALYLKDKGLNVLTLPKTIDNDVAMTDVTFGFHTALGIAPRPSTACTAPPTAITALSSSRSWAIAPAGSPSARPLPAAPTSS